MSALKFGVLLLWDPWGKPYQISDRYHRKMRKREAFLSLSLELPSKCNPSHTVEVTQSGKSFSNLAQTRRLHSGPEVGYKMTWFQIYVNDEVDELAEHVRQTAQAWKVLTIKCGKEMKLRRSWLDIDYPLAAPPEFERSG